MNDLCKRLFEFGTDTIKFTRKLPDSLEYRVIRHQLIKSCTSSGANYEEAQAGSSRADFTNKVRISLREMRESNYWLRTIKGVYEKEYDHTGINKLINESNELKHILGSIVTKMREK